MGKAKKRSTTSSPKASASSRAHAAAARADNLARDQRAGGAEHEATRRDDHAAVFGEPEQDHGKVKDMNPAQIERLVAQGIPRGLIIPQSVRNAGWVDNPPKPMVFDMKTTVKVEDDATRLFREQVEAEALAKKNKGLNALKESKRLKAERSKIDMEINRWNARKNRFEIDPTLVAAKTARLLAAGLKPTEPKVQKAEAAPKTKREAPSRTKGEASKPCAANVEPLPEKGKRRAVAVASYKDFVAIAALAKQCECSEGSIRSHFTDLHAKHGFGYELKDGAYKLITPKGWKP